MDQLEERVECGVGRRGEGEWTRWEKGEGGWKVGKRGAKREKKRRQEKEMGEGGEGRDRNGGRGGEKWVKGRGQGVNEMGELRMVVIATGKDR